MSDFSTQIFFILTLVFGVPGALFHRTIGRRFGHKRGYMLCISYWIIITGLFVVCLSSPRQKNFAFLFAPLYGIGYGWYYPSINGFFVSLVPVGRDVELWGWNMFASVALQWVPPVIFTALNESLGNMRLGFLSLILFHIVGLGITSTIPVGNGLVEGNPFKNELPESSSDEPIKEDAVESSVNIA